MRPQTPDFGTKSRPQCASKGRFQTQIWASFCPSTPLFRCRLERQDLERLQVEGMRRSRLKLDSRRSSLIPPRTMRPEMTRRTCRQLECLAYVQIEILRFITRIAQRHDSLLRRPRCPSVHLPASADRRLSNACPSTPRHSRATTSPPPPAHPSPPASAATV